MYAVIFFLVYEKLIKRRFFLIFIEFPQQIVHIFEYSLKIIEYGC